MKTISILLTSYTDIFSQIVNLFSNGYSHSSISIDESENIFYSFNRKGFAIEKPKKYKPKTRKNKYAYIRIQVPDNKYLLIQQEIDNFLKNKNNYKYAKIGVWLCLFHIPFKFNNKYFCSQFIASLLTKTEIIKLSKKETLYKPCDFLNKIISTYYPLQIEYS